jgi:hypothetical protein
MRWNAPLPNKDTVSTGRSRSTNASLESLYLAARAAELVAGSIVGGGDTGASRVYKP